MQYDKGEATHYITRRQALKRLQLSLNDFRRLCIIKGIYPREPKNRRKAQKGSTDIKILYHAKDIKFLLHEPIVWTLRKYKIFNRQTGRDRAVRDFRNLKRRLDKYPEMKIDHIVKERYPTFIDAVRDLDDCLTLLFLFSTFPSLSHIPRDQTAMCRRLSVEFMHYVISSQALREVFVSIKGYYFQAEIKGEKVTWIVPHYYPFEKQPKEQVDFKVMSIFVEFYNVMLGFVNFRLFHGLNLIYPPQLPSAMDAISDASAADESLFMSERVAALNKPILRSGGMDNGDEAGANDLDLDLLGATDANADAKIREMQEESKREVRLRTLFRGLKFFINREVPREPLVFVIRCFGGEVSWQGDLFPGATFPETDETITHQIVDRPSTDKQYISRDYIQPQWVFDSVNQRALLPTNKYFIGVPLPPHLSPFTTGEGDKYVPPEEKALSDPVGVVEDEEEESEDEEMDDAAAAAPAPKKKNNKKNKKANKDPENSRDAQLERAYWVEQGQLDKEDEEKVEKPKEVVREELVSPA